jgi:hypothetical protein
VSATSLGIAYQARIAVGRESCPGHPEDVCGADIGVIETPTSCLYATAGEDEGECETEDWRKGAVCAGEAE